VVWKLILAVNQPGLPLSEINASNARVYTVEFPNDLGSVPITDAPHAYAVSVAQLESDTGLRFFTNLPDSVRQALVAGANVGLPLLADPDGPAADPAAPVPLTADDPAFRSLTAAAVQVWQTALGLPAPPDVPFRVGGTADGELGEAFLTGYDAQGRPNQGTIWLSPDAGGVGWFVDPTPLDAGEFAAVPGTAALRAPAGSPAAGRYDLFTVVLHELGHLVGFAVTYAGFGGHTVWSGGAPLFVGPGFSTLLTADGSHLDGGVYPGDLMNPTLSPSVRELPSALDVLILNTARNVSPRGQAESPRADNAVVQGTEATPTDADAPTPAPAADDTGAPGEHAAHLPLLADPESQAGAPPADPRPGEPVRAGGAPVARVPAFTEVVWVAGTGPVSGPVIAAAVPPTGAALPERRRQLAIDAVMGGRPIAERSRPSDVEQRPAPAWVPPGVPGGLVTGDGRGTRPERSVPTALGHGSFGQALDPVEAAPPRNEEELPGADAGQGETVPATPAVGGESPETAEAGTASNALALALAVVGLTYQRDKRRRSEADPRDVLFSSSRLWADDEE
jgi:hypothetical protein